MRRYGSLLGSSVPERIRALILRLIAECGRILLSVIVLTTCGGIYGNLLGLRRARRCLKDIQFAGIAARKSRKILVARILNRLLHGLSLLSCRSGFAHRRFDDLDPDNTRQAKANDSYYLLKKTSSPIVIVECGFLSNNEEAQKLSSDLYQEKAAWAIHLAILQHLNDQK